MTKTHTLRTTQQLVEVGTTLTGSWFRGHAAICGELTPKIFRQEYRVQHAWRGGFEQSMIEHFKREAPVLLPGSPPPDDDYVSWLFLMQHHGTPTRLLDWTGNPLVAMYFVVSEKRDEDGELWAMHPDNLNKHSGAFGIWLPRSAIIRFLAAEPNWKDLNVLREKMGLTTVPDAPVAFRPPMNFSRMVAQLSTFTIHPKPKPEGRGRTIPEILDSPEYLVRYVVPSSCKRQIQQDLAALGITKRSLFLTLDALSESIIDAHRVVAYSPPMPPFWDNEKAE